MPISVKDFTWTQSNSKICINLPLKGTKSKNVDILNSQEFCKVSYPPFLFECWFIDKVKDEDITAIISNGIISLEFSKEEEKTWSSLFHPDFEKKELLKKVREDAIKIFGRRVEALEKLKTEFKETNKKLALKEQMKLEEVERQNIENIKENERKNATKEIENFKKFQINIEAKSITSELENVVDEDMKSNKKIIFDDIKETKNTEREEIKLPEPRSCGNIQIKFTPRVFPTPSRESQDKLEKEWLEKQTEARKISDLPEELKDLSANEKDLEWLKEKANNYYKQENYQVAIGVYNHAVKLFPKEPSLYSNRAACHSKVRNLIKCIEDCTRALDLLTPPVPRNISSRLKAHIRRGTAFCELELYAEGLLDYETAIYLDPDNKELQEDADNIRKAILGKQPTNDE